MSRDDGTTASVAARRSAAEEEARRPRSSVITRCYGGRVHFSAALY